MPMMQQFVVGGRHDSFGTTLEGPAPQSKNEAQLPPDQNHDRTTPPVGPQKGNKEVNPSKDKTSESSHSQIKSQVETLTEKMLLGYM